MWIVYSGTPRLYSEKSHFLHWLPAKEGVMALLCSTEWKLAKDPKRAAAYESEIQKLRQAGYVTPLTSAESDLSSRSWFIPHHMVQHNNKDRIVFNCSFEYQDQSLKWAPFARPHLRLKPIGSSLSLTRISRGLLTWRACFIKSVSLMKTNPSYNFCSAMSRPLNQQ